MTDQQIFPVKVQKAITRLQPPGRPDLEERFHNSMEQGRFLERSLGDALSQLKERRQDLQEKIDQYTNMNKLATDGQFPDSIRPAKYVVDSIKIVQEIQKYTQEVLNVAKAINETIGMYQSLKQNIQGYFQERLNALATLLNEICNFNLPSLPSIPNFFGNFTFDGFKFPKGAFQFRLSFDKNFAYGQCRLRGGDIDIFRNYPKTMNWNGVPTTIPVYRPPFSGQLYIGGQPANVSSITDVAYYSDFDPVTDFYTGPSGTQSGFPNPEKIVSDYHIPLGQFIERLSSLVGITTNIQTIVDSNYEPNLVTAWLKLIEVNRQQRAGDWIPTFQTAYDTFIKPSIDYIETNGIVWNNKLGGSGTKAGDINIPIITMLKSGNATRVGQIIWMLTYIESSLLGFDRNKNFDIYRLQTGTDLDSMVATYLSGLSGEGTDYVRYIMPSGTQTIIPLDSGGKSLYPTYINVPQDLVLEINSIISRLAIEIDKQSNFISQRPKYRYVYDNFGNQTILDKYSQFWREVADNWNTLISLYNSGDFNSSFILSYETTIQEYIDPLSPKSTLNTLTKDCDTRSKTWIPGAYTLPVFIQDPLELYPITTFTNPNDAWNGDELIEDKYLLRADIQGLTLNQKITMLQINRAYSVLRKSTQDMIASIDQAIATVGDSAAGFKYEMESQIPSIPTSGSDITYTKMDFDQSGYFLDGVNFKISVSGSYTISAETDWSNTDVGVRMMTLIKNDSQVLETKQSDPGAGPIQLILSTIADLVAGDTIKIRVSHNCLEPQTVASGYFSAAMTSTTSGTGGSTPPADTGSSTTGIMKITASMSVATGQCLKLNPDNTGSVILPTDPAKAPYIDGIALAGATAGNQFDAAYIHGSVYTISNGTFTPGPLFLGLNGSLTQVQPLASSGYAWYVQVGRAINSTTILMDSQLPIALI